MAKTFRMVTPGEMFWNNPGTPQAMARFAGGVLLQRNPKVHVRSTYLLPIRKRRLTRRWTRKGRGHRGKRAAGLRRKKRSFRSARRDRPLWSPSDLDIPPAQQRRNQDPHVKQPWAVCSTIGGPNDKPKSSAQRNSHEVGVDRGVDVAAQDRPNQTILAH